MAVAPSSLRRTGTRRLPPLAILARCSDPPRYVMEPKGRPHALLPLFSGPSSLRRGLGTLSSAGVRTTALVRTATRNRRVAWLLLLLILVLWLLLMMWFVC